MLEFAVLFPLLSTKFKFHCCPPPLPWAHLDSGDHWHLWDLFLAMSHIHFYTYSDSTCNMLLQFTRIRSLPIMCVVYSLVCSVIFMGGKLGNDEEFLVCNWKVAETINQWQRPGITRQKRKASRERRLSTFLRHGASGFQVIKKEQVMGLFNLKSVCFRAEGLGLHILAYRLPTLSNNRL